MGLCGVVWGNVQGYVWGCARGVCVGLLKGLCVGHIKKYLQAMQATLHFHWFQFIIPLPQQTELLVTMTKQQ